MLPWQSALIFVSTHGAAQSSHIPFVSQPIPCIHFCVHRTSQTLGTWQANDECFVIKRFKDFSSDADIAGSHGNTYAESIHVSRNFLNFYFMTHVSWEGIILILRIVSKNSKFPQIIKNIMYKSTIQCRQLGCTLSWKEFDGWIKNTAIGKLLRLIIRYFLTVTKEVCFAEV